MPYSLVTAAALILASSLSLRRAFVIVEIYEKVDDLEMVRFSKMNKLPSVSSVGDSDKIELANVDGAKLNSVSGSDISSGPLARCSHGCRELSSGCRHLRKKSHWHTKHASKSCYTKCSLMVS